MPIYPFQCPSCGRAEDQFARVDERDANPPVCCGAAMDRKLTAPMVFVPGDVAYECPLSGEVVTSQRRRADLMKEHNVVDARDYTQSWAKANAARAADRQLARDYEASLPDAVKKAAADMPA